MTLCFCLGPLNINVHVFWVSSIKYSHWEPLLNAPCYYGLYSWKMNTIAKMDFSPKHLSSYLDWRSGLPFSSASGVNTLDCMPMSLPQVTEQTFGWSWWLWFGIGLSSQPVNLRRYLLATFLFYLFFKWPQKPFSIPYTVPAYEVDVKSSGCCWCNYQNNCKQVSGSGRCGSHHTERATDQHSSKGVPLASPSMQ